MLCRQLIFVAKLMALSGFFQARREHPTDKTGENDSDEILPDHRFSMSRAHSPCCESERNHCCLLRRLSARYQNRCAEPERYRVSHFKREPNGNVNFRNFLLRICSSWASPQRTRDNPFHDSGSYSFSSHSRSWVILSALRRFRLLLSCTLRRQSVGTRCRTAYPPTMPARPGFATWLWSAPIGCDSIRRLGTEADAADLFGRLQNPGGPG